MEQLIFEVRVPGGGAASPEALERQVRRLGDALRSTFDRRYVADFDKQLLIMRLIFGRLKASIQDAAAQLGAVLLPALNKGLYAAVRFFNQVSAVLYALFGNSRQAASAQKKLADSLKSSGRAAKKALASFDQLERLDFSSGSGSAIENTLAVPTLSKEAAETVEKIRQLLQPLMDIDLSAASESLLGLKNALQELTKKAFAGLEWAWFHLLVPLAEWTAEEALPAFLDALAAALEAVGKVAALVKPALSWLWEDLLQPLARWAGEKVVAALQGITSALRAFGSWVEEKTAPLAKFIENLRSMAAAIGAGETGFSGLGGAAKGAMQSIGKVTGSVRSMGNGVIGLLNGLLSGVGKAINGVVAAVNGISLTIPAWVPGYGGKKLGFNLPSVRCPQIPYLAQGAVLPANKPFLAVVGDQKNGTNIEAPLATIEEAVAAVTGTGQQQTARLLEQILEAVLDIEIGDAVIGQAARRWQRRQAVMQGV